MKNYIIGFLLICILVLISLWYKNSANSILQKFPIEQKGDVRHGDDPIIFIYIMFSGNDCVNCLEVIDVLNNLPSQFRVIGIVPKEELVNEAGLREKSKAKFNLINFNKSHKKYFSYYSPSIFGVDENGKIFFIIPAVPGEKEYFESFLTNFYSRVLPLLYSSK